ncbi:alpha/beta-hydrolase [Apiospora arundinis]|uniref:Alpha/beta-hydrolase n=1 Tax=Apiospora arundinis TaxID=335852 RepID=A0ABR2HZR5_9PEZI
MPVPIQAMNVLYQTLPHAAGVGGRPADGSRESRREATNPSSFALSQDQPTKIVHVGHSDGSIVTIYLLLHGARATPMHRAAAPPLLTGFKIGPKFAQLEVGDARSCRGQAGFDNPPRVRRPRQWATWCWDRWQWPRWSSQANATSSSALAMGNRAYDLEQIKGLYPDSARVEVALQPETGLVLILSTSATAGAEVGQETVGAFPICTHGSPRSAMETGPRRGPDLTFCSLVESELVVDSSSTESSGS